MIKHNVPLSQNSPANELDCVSAVFQMVLKYFLPEKEFSRDYVNSLTGHISGKGTWFFPALIKMADMGFKIHFLEAFDYQKFLKEGEKYLMEWWGNEEKTQWYIKNSDILDKKHLIPDLLKTKFWEKKVPQMEDISEYLKQNYLVACDINAGVINNTNKYSPHLVLIIGMDKDSFIVNDPGINSGGERLINKTKFWEAWSYDGEARSLTAFKI